MPDKFVSYFQSILSIFFKRTAFQVHFYRGIKKQLFSVFISLVTILFLPSFTLSADMDTLAPHAYLEDFSSGSVLLAKEADVKMPPASMAKLVTAAVVFEEIKAGRLALTDEFRVSVDAHQRGGIQSGGSTMFLEPNSSVSVENLLRGAIIQSGNDACLVLAEGIAGTEQGFARMMNRFAEKIGMRNSHFTTSTGLPDPEQFVTARDLAKAAKFIIEEHPEFFKYYSEESFEWNKIKQLNRNPLLGSDIGADGMKTGFTDASGYGIVATAEQDGNRRILVINGLETQQDRRNEAYKLLDWSFRAFTDLPVILRHDIVGSVRVYGGESFSAVIRASDNITGLMQRGDEVERSYVGQLKYDAPLKAPLKRGQDVGILTLYDDDGNVIAEGRVEIAEDVAVGPIYRRALDAGLYLGGIF